MKSKTINTRISTNNSKTLQREESNKRIQLLVDKLVAHFKLRLASLITEKNYKYLNMVLDIKTFLKKLDNNILETESVIPKLEKHLLKILSKMPSDSSKYLIEISKINQILKTEINSNNYINPLIHSTKNISNSESILDKKINIKGNQNLVSNNNASRNNFYENHNYLKSLPNESSTKNNITKPGAHLAVNPYILTKGDIASNKLLTKTYSKKNILNIPNNKANDIFNNNITDKNEKLNNFIIENNAEKIIISTNDINKNILKTNDNYYPISNTNETLINNEILNTYSAKSNSITKLNNNKVGNLAKEAGLVLIQKTEKLNDLKEKAMDEWAMIVKYNHLKHLEEEQNKKNSEEEKKRRVREILENQMKEKDNLKKLKQEEDKKFFKMQSEKIVNLENDYNEKERLRLDKIRQQKETQDKLIKGIKID